MQRLWEHDIFKEPKEVSVVGQQSGVKEGFQVSWRDLHRYAGRTLCLGLNLRELGSFWGI